MITATDTKRIASTMTGERTDFTIKASGKAFRLLVDGLYSDKPLAVIREVTSNAHDSHVDAGCPDKPFDVHLPTTMEPTFRVRDYGTSMDHDTVMRLYTSMFDSTRDQSNDCTGGFGLGSKSPFAYSDTFTVRAYDGATVRSYIAMMGDDDIPSFQHVSTLDSDEPRGIEVTVPVARQDISVFATAMRRVLRGLPVRPNLNVDVEVPEPVMSGDGWELHHDRAAVSSYRSATWWVRQGTVIYPLTDATSEAKIAAVSPFRRQYGVILDVPIGSCRITPSREMLEFKGDTRQVVNDAIERAVAEITDRIVGSATNASTLIEAMRERDKLTAWFEQRSVRNVLNNLTWNGKPLPDYVEMPVKVAAVIQRGAENPVPAHFTVSEPHRWFFVIDRGEKVPRRRIRLNAIRVDGTFVRVVYNPTNSELSRLIDVTGVDKSRVVSIANLYDPGATSNNERQKATGVYDEYGRKLVDNLPDDIDWWLPLERAGAATFHAEGWGTRSFRRRSRGDGGETYGAGHLIRTAGAMGIQVNDLYFLSKKGQASYGVDESNRLDLAMVAEAKKAAALFNKQAYARALRDALPFDLRSIAKDGVFADDGVDLSGLSVTVPDININYLTSVAPSAMLTDSQRQEISAIVGRLTEKYPLLFNRTVEAINAYIDERKKNP